MPDAGYLTIGKVVKRLQPQYPDLSVSKVRYLEDEGLLTPSRTPGGYRLYSSRDVRRLERILFLQKSRFMPLSVIRQELDGVMEATDALAPEAHDPTFVPARDAAEPHPLERMPDILGVSISFVRQLSECGIIELVRSPHGRELVSGRDLKLIRACDQLRRFGIEPKNLRQYVAAANRESLMFEQALIGFSKRPAETAPQHRERLSEAFESILSLTNQVRGALIRRTLKETLADTEAPASPNYD